MSVPECIQKEVDRLDFHREKVLGWVDEAIVAEEAEEKFDFISAVTVGSGVHSLNGVLIHCNLKKPEDIAELLRWLGTKGYRQKGKPDDFAELKRRTWNLGNLQVMGFFIGDVCKFVKVGEETKDIMELRCEPADV